MKIKTKELFGKATVNNNISVNSFNPIIFTFCAVIGICIGVVCETINYDVYTTISVVYDDYLNSLSNFSFLNAVINCLCANLVFIIIAMYFGLCAVGSQLLYLIPFIKGLGVGAVCSYIYSGYSIKGVLYCLIIVFPSALLQFIAIILASSESRIMSGEILNLIEAKEKENDKIDLRFYILRYLIIFIITFISSIIYALMTQIFIKMI